MGRTTVLLFIAGCLLIVMIGCGSHGKTTPSTTPVSQNQQATVASKTETPLPNTDQQQHMTDTICSETFIDPSNGWVAVGQGDNNSFKSRILATVDGGHTWNQVSMVDGQAIYIGFFSMKHGWLFTGDSLKTTKDGGFTWQNESVPSDDGIELGRAQFVDEKYGFILGYGEGAFIPDPNIPGSGTTPSILVLYSTIDSGKTWSKEDIPAEIAKNEFDGSCDISFISD